MFPFSTLINTSTNNVVLDVDFRGSAIGTSDVIDKSGTFVFTKKNIGVGTNVVQYDSELGTNVMNFSSSLYSAVMPTNINLGSMDFTIRMRYKSSPSGIAILFSTGYYPSVPARVTGIAYQIHQNTGYAQTFVTGIEEAQYWRNLCSGASDSVWLDVTIVKVGTSVQCSISNLAGVVLGVSPAQMGQTFGSGEEFSIGGYYKDLGALFVGSIQYIRIETK